MDVGFETRIRPIPPIPENTTTFEAGAISFGLEYRHLTRAQLDEHLARQNLTTEQMGVTPGADLNDAGVSIHVFGRDGHEYLRFDCFDDSPHYHYIYPGQEHQRVVAFDRVANGEPLPWALWCLRNRLDLMLREAGAAAATGAFEPAVVAGVLDRLASAAHAALDAQRSDQRTPA